MGLCANAQALGAGESPAAFQRPLLPVEKRDRQQERQQQTERLPE